MCRATKILFLFVFLCVASVQGQDVVDDACNIAERLLKDYRFGEAYGILSGVSSGEAPSRIDTLRLQAETGERMLKTVTDVNFLDRIVVPSSKVFQTIPMYTDGGHYVRTTEIKELGAVLTGESAYMNDIGDAIFVSAADGDGASRICVSRKVGDGWTEPQPIDGLGEEFDNPCNPFVDADGTTLYFSARGRESLGGYDIFVTRYDAGTRRYLKPQNLGMPFNSPSDELLYTINEEQNIGYLLTNRGLSTDSMGVYIFELNESAGLQSVDSLGLDAVREYASFRELTLSRNGEAKSIIDEWKKTAAPSSSTSLHAGCRLVISDKYLITDVESLRSARARRIAAEWIKEKRTLEEQQAEQESLRYIYNKGMDDTARRIQELEQLIPKTKRRVAEMEKSIRRLEHEAIK